MKTPRMATRFTGKGSNTESAILMAREIPIHASWTVRNCFVLGSNLCTQCHIPDQSKRLLFCSFARHTKTVSYYRSRHSTMLDPKPVSSFWHIFKVRTISDYRLTDSANEFPLGSIVAINPCWQLSSISYFLVYSVLFRKPSTEDLYS